MKNLEKKEEGNEHDLKLFSQTCLSADDNTSHVE